MPDPKDNFWTHDNWLRVMSAVMRRAATDPAFREKSLTDPRGAVKEISGHELPADIHVTFADARGGPVIPLPPPGVASGELSDEALERVAGAGCAWFGVGGPTCV